MKGITGGCSDWRACEKHRQTDTSERIWYRSKTAHAWRYVYFHVHHHLCNEWLPLPQFNQLFSGVKLWFLAMHRYFQCFKITFNVIWKCCNWYFSSSGYSQLCSCLSHVSPLQYLVLLLCIFLLEIIAGVLAYITYQEVKYFSFCLYVFVHIETYINLI